MSSRVVRPDSVKAPGVPERNSDADETMQVYNADPPHTRDASHDKETIERNPRRTRPNDR